jgi:hypothetical protein
VSAELGVQASIRRQLNNRKGILMLYRSVIAIALMAVSANSQSPVVLHSGESIFTVTVRGGNGVRFRGSCLSTPSDGASVTTRLEGIVPAEFKIVGTALYLTVQNLTEGREPEVRVGSDGVTVLDQKSPNAQAGSWLEVEILKNGGSIKTQRTDAPRGVVSLSTTPPAAGAAERTELQVEGVRFAFITFTSNTGDIEQQLVPVPFSKIFYPKEGWIVGITAQKTHVTRLDPVHTDGRIETLDDGRAGEMTVAIRVNGQPIGSAQTSEPFGVASTTIRIP